MMGGEQELGKSWRPSVKSDGLESISQRYMEFSLSVVIRLGYENLNAA